VHCSIFLKYDTPLHLLKNPDPTVPDTLIWNQLNPE